MGSPRPLLSALALCAILVAVGAVILTLLGTSNTPGPTLFEDKVGLVRIQGFIGNAEPVVKALDKFRRDDSIRSVLIRIDSPGGVVAPSQEIYTEILRTRAKKPVVASMGSVAASGGYYIAAACTKIVASPGTITGSIGVISTVPNAEELFNKLGIRLQIVKSGPLKGAGQVDRPLSSEEREMLQATINQSHQQFVNDVARGRDLPVAEVRRLATGGIYTGSAAKSLGLVDQLGNFMDAISLAAHLGGIKGRPTLVNPEPERGDFWGQVLGEEALTSLAQTLLAVVQRYYGGGLMYLYTPASPAQ